MTVSRARSRTDRREELLEAADRVIRRLGPSATMDELATEAGITKPILYRHFGSKDGLYAALAERYMRVIFAEPEERLAETHPAKRIEGAVDALLASVEREPEIFRFLHHVTSERRYAADAAGAVVRAHAARIAQVTRTDLERAGVDGDYADPLAYGIVAMMQAIAAWWLETRTIPRERLVALITSLLWAGFRRIGQPPP
ncbi:MAG TPA: TetR/AcrR family transcriptional regulator [Gaiellaceae bacterium]